MIELDKLSKIGFGTYRVSLHSKENAEALNYAINCGCNLIDTASNYENGASEMLIGQVLKNQKDKKIFIITKAGYVSGDNLSVLHMLNQIKKGTSDLVDISNKFKHSIHPDYLEAQLSISLKRLNRRWIDGFLLHSPEYYFDDKGQSTSREEYYSRIKKAFEFLEEQVKKGIIRYYGVSSNTMGIGNENNTTDLMDLLKLSNMVANNNHFKLIQFPFNLVENEPIIISKAVNKSLVGLAKENRIITFANRPLNANTNLGSLRLVIHDIGKLDFNYQADSYIHNKCFSILEEQLRKVNDKSNLSQFPLIEYLKNNWMTIPHEEAFNKLFDGSFFPFANLLYNNDIPKEIMTTFVNFKTVATKYYLKTATLRVTNYLKENDCTRLLPASTFDSFQKNLCKEYLNLGIDHILIGMRKFKYVNEMKTLFK